MPPPNRWKWYSIYNIDPPRPRKNLTRAEIKECIELFRDTADVHASDNFDLTAHTLDDYCDRLIDSADNGYLAMALRPAGNGHYANTLFFQKSKGLTSFYGHDAWVVSLGFDDAGFPAHLPEPAATRGYLRRHLNTALDQFMTALGVSVLYLVEPKPIATPTTAPPAGARPIARIDFYGRKRPGIPDGAPGNANRSDWEKDMLSEIGDAFSGPGGYFKHWAGETGNTGTGSFEFVAMRIKRR
jgi:hypothetical protein